VRTSPPRAPAAWPREKGQRERHPAPVPGSSRRPARHRIVLQIDRNALAAAQDECSGEVGIRRRSPARAALQTLVGAVSEYMPLATAPSCRPEVVAMTTVTVTFGAFTRAETWFRSSSQVHRRLPARRYIPDQRQRDHSRRAYGHRLAHSGFSRRSPGVGRRPDQVGLFPQPRRRTASPEQRTRRRHIPHPAHAHSVAPRHKTREAIADMLAANAIIAVIFMPSSSRSRSAAAAGTGSDRRPVSGKRHRESRSLAGLLLTRTEAP